MGNLTLDRKKYNQEYWAKNRERLCKNMREEYRLNKKYHSDRRKKFYYSNLSYERLRRKENYKKNKEKELESNRKYLAIPKNKIRHRAQKRRSYALALSLTRKLNSFEKYLVEQFELKVGELNIKYGKGKYHLDHIVPLIAGGQHVPENLQILTVNKHNKKSKLDRHILRAEGH